MAASARSRLGSVFDSQDEEAVDTDMMRRPVLSASESRVKKQAEREQARALAEDPTVFEYDTIHDDIQARRNEKTKEQKVADKDRTPKYVDNLLKAHRRRELEFQVREERKQQKERAAEGEQFADKEVFVTGAYRQQMDEMQKFRQEQAMEERIESVTDVTKQTNYLSGFYRKVLNDMSSNEMISDTAVNEKEMKTEAATVTEDQQKSPSTKDDKQTDDSKIKTGTGKKLSSKPKVYRKRRSSSDSENDREKHQQDDKISIHKKEKKREKTKSLDNDEQISNKSHSDSENDKEEGLENNNGRLKSSVQKVTGKNQSRERHQRFFTPSPEPETKNEEEKDQKMSSKERGKGGQKSPLNGQKRKSTGSKPSAEDGEKKPDIAKKDPLKIRLERLRAIFTRKTSREQLEQFRQRYFVRKADGLIVAPI